MTRRRKLQVVILSLVAFIGGAGFAAWYFFIRVDDTPNEPQPSTITISKETTFALSPVDKYGYVHYAEAIDREYRKGVTPENNAAVPFWRAFGPEGIPLEVRREFFERLGIPELPDVGEYINVSDQRFADVVEAKFEQQPWKRAEFPELAKWFDDNAKPIQVLIEATKRPKFYSPMLSPDRLQGRQVALNLVLHDCQRARVAARILLARTMWHIGERRFKDARTDIQAGHRLARLINQQPTLIGGLVAIAVDALIWNGHVALAHSGRLSIQQLKSGGAEFQKLDDIAGFSNRLNQCDRLIILDCATLLARNGWDAFDAVEEVKSRRTAFERFGERQILTRADWNEILRAINRHFDRAVAIGRIANRAKRRAALDQFTRNLDVMRFHSRELPELTQEAVTQWFINWLVADMCPAFGQAWVAEDRNRLRLRMTPVIYALAAYHKEIGRYPQKLAELSPKYLKTLPNDPHNDGPLIYTKTNDGYRLGSFGENGREDVGRTPDDDPPSDDFFITTPKK